MLWTLDVPAGNFFGGSDPVAVSIGMVVCAAVFAALIIRGKMKGAKAEGKEELPVSAPAVPSVSPVPAYTGPVSSSAQVRNGVDAQTTAVISAAVAASMPEGQNYTIKSIDLAD